MGCVSSKGVDAAVVADVYHPPPTSIAFFNIDTIGEPWLITTTNHPEKPTHVPLPILEKLDSFEVTPHSWSEVSKALEDLKPALHNPPPPTKTPPSPPPKQEPTSPPRPPQKNHSFHTLEELDSHLSPNKKPTTPSTPPPPPPTRVRSLPPSLPEGVRPVSQNKFVLQDRQERENRNSSTIDDPIRRWRRDPLEGFPERCPPGGADRVVLYTTSLRGVRRTFEDCERARQAVEGHCLVDVDERDVSLHGEYLKELRELLGEDHGGESSTTAVPRLFVKGRYVGGVDEVVDLNETGRLRLMLRLVAKHGVGDRKGACGGCGGARFVPCLECNGSCKVLGEDGKGTARCGRCNENGLLQCPLCH